MKEYYLATYKKADGNYGTALVLSESEAKAEEHFKEYDAKTGATSLMRPTLENIKACFAGTPQESIVEQDLNYFDTKGILGKIESARETLFVMTASSVDAERMKQCVEDTRKAITFEKVIADSSYDVAKQFLPTDNYLKQRMRIINVSPANARQEAEKIEITDNHIPTFFLFAKNEAEQGKIKETIPAIFERVGKRCIVVDFSSLPFTDVLFAKFIDNKAKEKYFSTLPSQKSQCDLAKKISKEVLDEWIRKLITTSLYVYSAPDKMVQKVGGANLRKTFKEINSEFYGCGLEEISQNDKLFAESGFKEQTLISRLSCIQKMQFILLKIDFSTMFVCLYHLMILLSISLFYLLVLTRNLVMMKTG